METLYLLVPLSLVLVALIVGVLWWAVYSGQYDDVESSGHAILMDDDTPPAAAPADAGAADDGPGPVPGAPSVHPVPGRSARATPLRRNDGV